MSHHDDATVFYLVRHALCDAVGKWIAGRSTGLSLNDDGRAQATSVAERLRTAGCEALYSSPMERALETSESIAAGTALPVVTAPAFHEIDFGEWTGSSIADLDTREDWRRFNSNRSWAPIPGGELMAEVQARAVAGMVDLRRRHRASRVIVVTHADVIRAVLCYAFGAPLDMLQRFECEPASISVVSLSDEGVRVLRVNDCGSRDAL